MREASRKATACYVDAPLRLFPDLCPRGVHGGRESTGGRAAGLRGKWVRPCRRAMRPPGPAQLLACLHGDQ
eukprot:20932-Eustigmatos_ZCMA.PRE.1